ncbi:phosphatase PAP2 family protein [Nonomuraea sp. NPDC049152]|uniref:phosphatase PAP2 family protein n=1 Tax=Nonomuraea sp. NPDC049152 TaxID=3154350 RepID=UPI0033FEDB1F
MATLGSVSAGPVTDRQGLLAGCGLFALLLLVVVWSEWRFPGNGRVALLRFAYPLLALPFMYAAAARTILALHGRFLDEAVNAWELWLFGAHPNVAVAAIGSPLLTELLTFCYFSFYGCFLIPIFLYIRGHRALGERYLFAALLALLICYLGFMFVPLAGPALSLPDQFASGRPSGYVITALQDRIMAAFDPPGAYFPSPHVAGAWITLLCLGRFASHRVHLVLCVLTTGLTIAVVYDWYHYASDAVAGLLVALAAHVITRRLGARGAFESRAVPGPDRVKADQTLG